MKIYLAIPYSAIPDMAHAIANEVAAHFMSVGHVVFSPISHGHHISDHMDEAFRFDHTFWMNQDLPFIEWCDAVYVVSIGENGDRLIDNSRGVQEEMATALKLGKPIITFIYDKTGD